MGPQPVNDSCNVDALPSISSSLSDSLAGRLLSPPVAAFSLSDIPIQPGAL